MHRIEKERLMRPPRLVGRLMGSILLAGAVGVIPIILVLYVVVNYLPVDIPIHILVGLTPVYYTVAKWIFNLAFLVIARVQLKPLEEGTHEIDMRNKNVRNWLINGMLTSAAKTFIGKPPFGQPAFNSFVFKFLKCKMGPGATAERIADTYLTEMGRNSVGGGNSLIVSHITDGKKLYLKKVKIGDGAVIGVNSLIFPGVEVGEGAVIGAYSFVPRDTKIPPNTVWVGIPAKQIYPKPEK
ncbi:MAG: DapH/DapD/GlmU-related protein [Candidatus Jordarchaeaceae archaeon]